MVSLGLFDFG